MRVIDRTVVGRSFLTAALVLAIGAPLGAQVSRIGTYSPPSDAEAVRHTDASDPANIVLLDENYKFVSSATNAAFSQNRTYVIDGQYLLEFKRHDLVTGPLRSYDAGTRLLDVEVGNEYGLVLLLTSTDFQIVNLDGSPSPRAIASVPISNNQPEWGELITRFGDAVYVADNALKGFQVFDISDPAGVLKLAQYTTAVKAKGKPSAFTVTDLRREGSVLSLMVGGNLELISVDNLVAPTQLLSLGSSRFRGATRSQLSEGFAFLVTGPTVHIVHTKPGTPEFLSEALAFDASADITDLFLRSGRLYLLCGNIGYEIWDVSAYALR